MSKGITETDIVAAKELSTVAISWHIKRSIERYLRETSDDPRGQLPFKLEVFRNGDITKRWSLEEVRLRSEARV
ncbi:MAG: hypothetical protein ABW171_17640 [Steroidobacter sp.]